MMDQQQRLLANTGIMVVVLLGVVIILFWGMIPHTIDCPDGERRRINLRGFVARYADHPLDVEPGGPLSKNLPPADFAALSRAAHDARQLPRAIVMQYNGCRITLKDYFHLRERCRDLHDIARRIDELDDEPAADRKLRALAKEYVGVMDELR